MPNLTTTVADLVADTAFFSLASAVTGLTGGGATNLDGIVTVSLATGTVATVWNGTQLSFYRLTAGTTAESSPTVIRPDDYATSTNEKVWVLVPAQTGALAVRGGLAVGVASPATPIDLRGASVLSAGVNMVALIADDTAFAAGVGGGVGFVGLIDGSTSRTLGFVGAQKENGTSGNQQGRLVFFTRPSAGNLVEAARIDSGGNLIASQQITGLTGGGVTKLDGIVTVGLSAGAIVQVWTGTGLKLYRLTTGTLAENSPWIVRPDDYATTTNEKYWRLESPHAVTLLGSGLWDVPATTFTLPDFATDPTFTVPLAGDYWLHYTVVCQWKANAGGLLNLRVRDTTASVSEVSTELVSIGASGAATLSGSHRATLVAGNTVALQVCNTAGASGDLELIKASLTYEWSPPAA